MLHDRTTSRRTVARHDIDHAIRKSSFLSQLSHPQAAQRSLLGRLHYDRVASSQCRAPFPGHHQHREVPGDNLADNTDRLTSRISEIIASNRNRLPMELVSPTGE